MFGSSAQTVLKQARSAPHRLYTAYDRRRQCPLRNHAGREFIFIHINKTGGTSVAKAVGLPRKAHLTVREVIDWVGQGAFERAFTFAFVRNPWDKVYSHYTYRVRTNATCLADRPLAFTDWVRVTYGQDKDFYYYDLPKMFMPQVEWLKDHDGRIQVDKIGRFEQLDQDFGEIASTIGLSAELPHLNRSRRSSKPDYRDAYTDETREMVGEWFAEDIAMFGYRFGG